MRLSADWEDSGFAAYDRGRRARPPGAGGWVRVFLRDAEVPDVLTVDDEEGLVVRMVRDAAGNYIVEGDHARTEEVRGQVRIDFPAWWPKGDD